MAQTAVDNEAYFGELDAVVGDGDFGYSLARGFEIVLADWDDLDRTDAATFLRKVARDHHQPDRRDLGPDLGHRVPARRRRRWPARPNHGDDVVEMLRAAIEGIKARGQSDVGDKTLLELVPATAAHRGAARRGGDVGGALAGGGRDRARVGRGDHEMLAKRGRAAYTGERSIGSPDAGAVAVAVHVRTAGRPGPRPEPAGLDQHARKERRHEEVRQRPEGLRAGDAARASRWRTRTR